MIGLFETMIVTSYNIFMVLYRRYIGMYLL